MREGEIPWYAFRYGERGFPSRGGGHLQNWKLDMSEEAIERRMRLGTQMRKEFDEHKKEMLDAFKKKEEDRAKYQHCCYCFNCQEFYRVDDYRVNQECPKCSSIETMVLEIVERKERGVKHIHKEGSREHVIMYSTLGRYCSDPNCEVNRRREERDESQK